MSAFLAAILEKLLVSVLGKLCAWVGLELKVSRVNSAIDKGETDVAEKELGSANAGKPSGNPGTQLRKP